MNRHPGVRPITHLSSLATLLLAWPLGAAAQAATSAGEIARAVCAGTVRSEALTATALQKARDAAPLNAFVTLDADGALAAAKAVDAGRGRARCGPLAGVPIVVKDNIDVRGLPTTAGTPALKHNVARRDAPVVEKLRAAGAVIIGKTQMHELAFGVSGWNPTFATGRDVGVRNAYDLTRVAGGSSSGTGAAVGAGIVAAGLGTDTGGSVRVPCAFNGCASLRPTIDRYSQRGIVPISHTRDTAGPMAMTLSDVALLDRVIAGGTPVRTAPLRGVRLGRVASMLANTDADTRAAFDAAIGKLQSAGVTIVDVDMPGLAELNGAVSFPVALYEAYDDLAAYLKTANAGVTVQQVAAQITSADVKGTYDGLVIPRKLPGPNNTLVDAKPVYTKALRDARPKLIALYRKTFRSHRIDALVFPTVPIVAPPANPDSSSMGNFMTIIQNTDPGSNAGVPGVQVPIGLGATTKLPVGLELDGPAGSDRRLLSIGMAVEQVMGRLPAPAR